METFIFLYFSPVLLINPIPIAISTAMNAQQTLNLKEQAGVNYIRITTS